MRRFFAWLVWVFTDVEPAPFVAPKPRFYHVGQVRGALSNLHNALTGDAFAAHSFEEMEEIRQGMVNLVKEIDYRRNQWRDGRIQRALDDLARYGIGEKEITAVLRGEKEKPPIERAS